VKPPKKSRWQSNRCQGTNRRCCDRSMLLHLHRQKRIHLCWENFQINMDMALINYALEQEWTDLNRLRQRWMWQKVFLPCGCETCFFHIKCLTNGIAHKKAKQTTTIFVQPDNTWTMRKIVPRREWTYKGVVSTADSAIEIYVMGMMMM
jgi:hypothetical protein